MANEKPAVLADALNAGKDVFLRARLSLDHLPPAPETPAPATLAEAQQLVAEKQQAVLHKEPKQKQKKKEHTQGEPFHGSRVGGANGNSAYWTLVEEYFRDVTRQDVLNLLSFCIDPDEDDALLVPQLGRPAEDALQPQPPLHLPSATAAKAARTAVPPTYGSVAAAASDDGDDAYEVKRSSRLSAKAQRRIENVYGRPDGPGRNSPADQYSRETQGYAAPALRPVSSPYCLLDQLPAADLLLMANVSMLLQQMNTVDLAAALGPSYTADDLAALIDQALQPQTMPPPGAAVTARGASDPYDDAARVVGGFQAPRPGYGGLATVGGGVYDVHSSVLKPQKSNKQKDKEAAAANAWAYVSAGVGGPQLTEQQRGVLVAWLQQQCGAPGVGDGRLGPIAAPWVPPDTPAVDAAATDLSTAAAAAAAEAVAAQSAAGVEASAAADPGATAADTAGSLQQQEQHSSQQQEEPADSPGAMHNSASNPAANPAGATEAAADPGLAPADAGGTRAAAAEAASGAANVAAGAAAAGQQQLQQPDCAQAVGQGVVTVVDTATAANTAAAATAQAAPPAVAEPAVDPYDENLARLDADAKKRADRRAAELIRRRLEARLELHPYIKALLQRPLPPHIADPGWDMQETLLGDDEPDDATAASGAAANNSKSSAAGNKKTGTPAADSSAAVDEYTGAETDAAGLPPSGSSGKAKSASARGRSRGRFRGKKGGAARGGKAAGSASAGKTAGGAETAGSGAAASAAGDGRGAAAGKADDRAPQSAAAQAVAAIIAGAPAEGSLDQQWAVLDSSADVLALAPDDEVLAELLTLQGELLQQTAINRARLGVVLQAAMDDIPNQRAAQAERATWEADVVSYMTAVREARKAAKREKREQERRQAVEEAAAMLPLSPRHTAARASRAARESSYGGDRGGDWVGGSEDFEENTERGASPAAARGNAANQTANEDVLGADGAPLVDTLSSRANDDALCSICSEGHSEAPNQIMFCERCDVAVHQVCYGVDAIPDGEWLCWPCLQYEEQMRRQGINQADIRPPRWMGVGLTGGARSVQCTLCPMHCGAFKQFNDGSKRWVHCVCALWHPETKMPLDVNEAEVVTGSDKLEDRLAATNQQLCQVCRRAQGVPVKCSFGHCATTFHPLCGRARGWYLAIRAGSKSGTYQYKAYCSAHSDAQRQKDREAAERAALLAQGLVPVPDAPKASRRGRPPAGAFSMDDYDDSADLLPTPTAVAPAPALPPPIEIDAAVLEATALKEQKIWVLQGVRFELETLRMLADQVKRREKIKVQCARAASEVHEARLEDPAAGLEQLAAEMAENAATAAAIPDTADDTAAAAAAPGDDTVAELAAAVAGFDSSEAVGDALFGTGIRAEGQELDGDLDQLQQQLLAQQDGGLLQPIGAIAAADADEPASVTAGLEDALSMLQALAAAEPAAAVPAAPAAESPGLPKALSPASIEAMVKRAAAAAAVNGAAAVFEPAVGSVSEAQVVDQQQEESEQQPQAPAAAAGPPAAAAAEGPAAVAEIPQQLPESTAAATPAAAAAASEPSAAAAAQPVQQQESQDLAVLESPTAAGVGSSKRARKLTAAASAAAEEAAAAAAAVSKGGKPPRQPLAGNKRSRGAAAAAGADSEVQQQQQEQQQASTPAAETAADGSLIESGISQKMPAAAVAAEAAPPTAAVAADVPVPIAAVAKRRRTAAAAAGRRAAAATGATGHETAAVGDVAAAAGTAPDGEPRGEIAAVQSHTAAEAGASGQESTAAAGAGDQQQLQQANAVGRPDAAAAGAGEAAAAPTAAATAPQGPADVPAAVHAQPQPQRQRQQPATGSSKALGSRKRARPADDDSTAAAAVGGALVADPQHAASTEAAGQPALAAAAATNTSADAAAADQPSSEAAAAAAAPNAQQQLANHKSQKRSGPSKRSTAKELAMLQDQLKNSFFHPVGGPRSRRPSRDGSGGGAADTAAAAAEQHNPQQQQQQQQVLEPVPEATDVQENQQQRQQQEQQEEDDTLSREDDRLVNVAAAAAALAEAFSSSDDAAAGDGAAAAAAAAAAATGKPESAAAAEASADVAGAAAVNCLSPRQSGGGRKPRVSKSGKGSKQQQQRSSPGPGTRSSPGPGTDNTGSKGK